MNFNDCCYGKHTTSHTAQTNGINSHAETFTLVVVVVVVTFFFSIYSDCFASKQVEKDEPNMCIEYSKIVIFMKFLFGLLIFVFFFHTQTERKKNRSKNVHAPSVVW